ncbi:MAG TPA: hypothetical protein VH914_06380 [Acidimicrobiia bacterium]|nr:hypothetical protein [Acidimicrobiia bacterium]
MDRVELAVVDVPIASLEPETTPAVSVHVNGRPLEAIWADACGDEATPIWVGDTLLGSKFVDGAHVGGELIWRVGVDLRNAGWFDAVDGGRVGVLTCACGGFACGGAAARVEATRDTVTWSEFHRMNGRGPVPVGPFTFDRREYEREIDALERAVRAVRDV